MHDGIELERRGVPTAVVVTTPFVGAGRAMADLDGRPDYRFSVIRHPSAELHGEELVTVARGAASDMEAILLGR